MDKFSLNIIICNSNLFFKNLAHSARVYFTSNANFAVCKNSCQFSRQKNVSFERKLRNLMYFYRNKGFVKNFFLTELWTDGYQLKTYYAQISSKSARSSLMEFLSFFSIDPKIFFFLLKSLKKNLMKHNKKFKNKKPVWIME